MKMSSNESRQVRKVIGTFEMWDGRRAREVVASYGEDTTRREIEVGIDEEYVSRYAEIEDE
jgi:hypothetical protein